MNEKPFNPYAATTPADATTGSQTYDHRLPQPGEATLVNQVVIVGVLQICLGILETLAGGGMVAMGFFMGVAMRQTDSVEPPPEMMVMGMQAFYWVIGGLVLLFAIMRVAAGIGCFWFRGRIWLIISLFGGLLSAMTCYCAPFSVGLCIYGLIVAFSSGVIKAYQLRNEGVSPQEIKRRFDMAQYAPQQTGPPINQ